MKIVLKFFKIAKKIPILTARIQKTVKSPRKSYLLPAERKFQALRC